MYHDIPSVVALLFLAVFSFEFRIKCAVSYYTVLVTAVQNQNAVLWFLSKLGTFTSVCSPFPNREKPTKRMFVQGHQMQEREMKWSLIARSGFGSVQYGLPHSDNDKTYCLAMCNLLKMNLRHNSHEVNSCTSY